MLADPVLEFWFEETAPAQWWKADPAFDRLIESRFLDTLHRAARGELRAWRETPSGRLAEIIVLDQFSRNVWRGTPRAFAQDGMALVLSQEAVCAGALTALDAAARAFLLMPYMHSESRAIHVEAEALFREHAPAGSYDFELRHKAIVDRYGRYPHRNAILGRDSTDAELEFLKQPGSSF
ncbi:MAG: DUF924 domain-containing protein [Rhodocyclaceae bacterium]|nr:DUF924 domain-containing protein [Rhodocyclaceae bacterium]